MHIWHRAPGESRAIDDHGNQFDRLFKDMQEGLKTDYAAVVYKDINKIKRRYDFHKTKSAAVPDSQNLCISCHGDIPHFKDKKIRSFLNMHAFFMACETCHIRPESGAQFRFVWYDKTTGKEKDEIDLNHFLAYTPYKLMPLNRDGTKVYDSDQIIEYVVQFKSTVREMHPEEKRAALKVVHKPVTEIKHIVRCEQCHTADSHTAYLPFRQIGYPQRRAEQLAGNEVVGMINNYKKFYMPNLLIPKEGVQNGN